MVVCLKHVDIRLRQGEFENVSEDTCCSWSAHAVWPGSLVNIDMCKDLIHIGCGERDQSSGTASALMHVSVLFSSTQA
jgi:hypothetical protein